MKQDNFFTDDGRPKPWPIDPSADCSADALAKEDAETLRARVAALYAAFPAGYTADEASDVLVARREAVDELSVRPRVSELKRVRVLIPTGERRTNRKGSTCAVMVHRMYWFGVK